MPDCFVIMPISTPSFMVEEYDRDENHFRHVLDHLFQPAIESAGYKMIPPSFDGSVLIPAEIVASLEQSDLVLCDISSLNANVFFELGIRTALNKPVALVKDGLTDRIPFDTGIIGHHTYDHSLTPWTLSDQIEQLTSHLKVVSGAGGQNAMWKYFGMRLQAGAPTGETGVDERLDFIMQRLDELQSPSEVLPTISIRPYINLSEGQRYTELANLLNRSVGNLIVHVSRTGAGVTLSLRRPISAGAERSLIRIARDEFGFELLITPSSI